MLARPTTPQAGRVQRARHAVNHPRWTEEASGLAALCYATIVPSIVQVASVPFGGGGLHEPLPLLAGGLGMAYATLLLPRNDRVTLKPSFWAVTRAGAADRLLTDRRDLEQARRVVWLVGVYLAVGVVTAATAPIAALEGWFLAGGFVAVGWWYRSCREGRRLRQTAAQR